MKLRKLFTKMLSFLIILLTIVSSLPKESVEATEIFGIFDDSNKSIKFESERINVEYTVLNSWSGASEISVKIYNTTDEVIHNWALAYTTVDTLFNVQKAQDIGRDNYHIMKNLGWNQDIPIGGYVDYTYTQYYNSEIDIPKEFELLSHIELTDESKYHISIVEQNRWENNAIIMLIIENLSGDEAIEDWSLNFESNFTIDSIWNASLVSQNNSSIEITNLAYDQNIAPKNSLSIGMQVHSEYGEFNSKNFELRQIKNTSIINNTIPDNSENVRKYFIDSVSFSQTCIEVGNQIPVIVSAKIIAADEVKVKLYSEEDNDLVFLGELYDNGKLNLNKDEITGDGIFTNQFTLTSEERKNKRFKIILFQNDVELDSYVQDINYYDSLEDNDLLVFLNDCELINSFLDNYYLSNEYYYGNAVDITNFIKNECPTQTCIVNIENLDGNTIKIIFENGMEYNIGIVDGNDMENMPRGLGEDEQINQYNPIEVDITMSNKIFYWAPFDSAWGDSDETNGILDIIKECGYSNQLKIFRDEDADVASLKEICKYGLIVFATHGISGEWIATGEKATASSVIYHKKEIASKQLSIQSIYDVATKQSNIFIAVGPKWFINNIDYLPKSIVVNNSCYSMTDNWADVFIKKGAGAYFGNNGKVTNAYASKSCVSLISELVENRNITGYSYNISIDSYYDNGASFLGKGQGNLALSQVESLNGFENGISMWDIKGDCRLIHKLGTVEAVEGDNMVMVSTGVGNTMSGGAISTYLHIPTDAKKMFFSWNFLSAEFLEYIDTQFDDPFYITITDNNVDDVIFKKTINTVAKEFGAGKNLPGNLVSVPEIVLNDCGDIWMTGWQNSCVDISKYAGKDIKITLSADNAADTAVPSAMLIDDLHLDIEELGSERYYDLNEFVRGGSQNINSKGKSYIFYIEEFEGQAKEMQKSLKYTNYYSDKSQVELYEINSEKEFIDRWNNMAPGDGDTKIDSVAIFMHGNYYAIIINAENKENLVVDSEGLAGSDDSATPICSLNRKEIRDLHLYSCNAGLLDAIDCKVDKVCNVGDKSGSTYSISSNVAVEFMKLGGIGYTTAYDGSVGFTVFNKTPRLSHAQNHFFEFLDEIRPSSKVNIKRFSGRVDDISDLKCSENKPYYSLTGVAPNGEVTYYKNHILYSYKKDISVPLITLFGYTINYTKRVYEFEWMEY